ncbi:hypothetical protein HCG51_08540 [Tolypothrix sp. PCC 7910]|uniref:hypothetical protein n=1 Tax=Tolypothrix sp. PCC 7910 TaxID=2099387 RepID=UPI0014278813|nr:hypothetical protein [Tolypothrix sp. PCC 7910]QIR36786.1 hypothetical protein HCG51_08540 [Tolypothrix sp. PCC 7910]
MDETQKEAITATNSDRQNKNKNSDYNYNRNNTIALKKLLQDLKFLPEDWALVAVGNQKAPLGKNWQKTPLSRQDFEAAFQVGEF